MEKSSHRKKLALSTTCYFRNITILTKNLCLLKYSNNDHGMLFFQFCSFVFNDDFSTKYIKFLINKGFANFCNINIETVSLILFLRLKRWLWAGDCLSKIDFFM